MDPITEIRICVKSETIYVVDIEKFLKLKWIILYWRIRIQVNKVFHFIDQNSSDPQQQHKLFLLIRTKCNAKKQLKCQILYNQDPFITAWRIRLGVHELLQTKIIWSCLHFWMFELAARTAIAHIAEEVAASLAIICAR